MASAQQLQQALSTTQLDQHPSRRHTRSSPVLIGPAAFLATCRDDASASPRPAARACWSKSIVEKLKHSDPVVSQPLELNSQVYFSTSSESSNISPQQSPMINSNRPMQSNLPLDLWSPVGGCSSSEENNSPTDVNSCKQIKDKPPMQKNLDVVQENPLGDDLRDMARPPSGGYINEASTWEGTTASNTKFSSEKKPSKFSNYKKFTLDTSTQTPTAPPREGGLLQASVDRLNRRSYRLFSDHPMPSSSSSSSSLSLTDTTVLSERSEATSNCLSKRTNHLSSASSTSNICPPPPPERHDSLYVSLSEERELRAAPWFQAGIPREITLEILNREPTGSFMVRESTSKPGCFALSLRVPREFHESGIAHYLILRTNRGYKIKGFTKEFGTLAALITHHSVMPELLPCPLSLSRYHPALRRQTSEDMVEIDEAPDYNLLSDFRKILADINV